MSADPKSGFVAIVGRPNAGKSTLLNALIGEKLSIVTAKAHTTRHRILGVLNRGDAQAVFIDTPGHARRTRTTLHRIMARVIHQAIEDCDLALLVVDARAITREDLEIIDMLGPHIERTVLVLNKIDRLKRREDTLPLLQKFSDRPFLDFVPVSAARGTNMAELVEVVCRHLPPGPKLFPDDMQTDRDLKFRAAELIREKLTEHLHKEIPYGLTVEVEHIGRNEADDQWLVHALIWLEKDQHKPIVIGAGGSVLKRVGSLARQELATLLGGRVHLEMWVKIREHWSDSERELGRLGFDVQ